jgi:hypothetical protein
MNKSVPLNFKVGFLLLLSRCGDTVSQWSPASNGPFVHPPDDTKVNMEQLWNDIDSKKTEGLRQKRVPGPLLSSEILQNGVGAITFRPLTTRAYDTALT